MPANDWPCNFSCTADLLVVSHIEERSSLHSPHLGSFRIYAQACNLETGNDSIAFLQLCDPPGRLIDNSHKLISKDITIPQFNDPTLPSVGARHPTRLQNHTPAIEVQITPTNSGSSNLDNHILRIRDRRNRDLLNAHIIFAVPTKGLHSRAAGTVFVGVCQCAQRGLL